MKLMVYVFCLAGVFSACAQNAKEVEAAPEVGLQSLFEDPNGKGNGKGAGNLAGVLKGFIGEDNANRYFYFPTRDEPSTPAKWGLKYDNVNFKSTDGTNIHGWFLPSTLDDPKGTVVFSHGNAGSIGHHLWFTVWFVKAGYNVFLYDYRGFGRSGGQVDRKGMIEDVKSAFRYVSKRPDVDARRLVSYGHSLGGAKSITAFGESQLKVKGIIIDGAFASYRDMAKVMGGELGGQLITDELSPRDYIGKITDVPILVVHGTSDQVVPLSQGLDLYKLANKPKTLFKVKKGEHGDSLSRDDGAYRKKVLTWLDELMAR